VDVRDSPAQLRCDHFEVRLVMPFPTISDDPLEALVTVMDFRLQLLELACPFTANACLNVLISLGLGKAVYFQLAAFHWAGTFARFVARQIVWSAERESKGEEGGGTERNPGIPREFFNGRKSR